MRHLQNPVEIASQLRRLAIQRGEFLFAHFLVLGRLFDFLNVFEAADAFADGGQIRESPAEPALIHIKLAAGQGRFLDRFLCLLLAADKQNTAAAPGHLLEELGRAL